MTQTKLSESEAQSVLEMTRQMLLDSQNRLEEFFFGPNPLYDETAAGVKLAYPEREQQMIVLLSMYANMDYKRRVAAREHFLSELLTPQKGECEH